MMMKPALVAAVLTLGAGGHAARLAAVAHDQNASPHADSSQELLLDLAVRPGALRFSPCVEDGSVDCGTLRVPVDYDRPQGEWFGLSVARVRATNPAGRLGVLMSHPGGPGVSGVDFVLGVAHAPGISGLRARFDIVSFDPRGVKRSRPVRCAVQTPPRPSPSDDGEGLRADSRIVHRL